MVICERKVVPVRHIL